MRKTKTTKRAFTLVELLAVIVILAIILVIAVPQIMDTIEKSKKGSMESSAKLVASEVELKYNAALTTGDEFNTSGSCISYGNLDTDEYDTCTYTITDGKAKITLKGKTGGKFDGYTCTDATKIEATCTKGSASSIPGPVAFATDSWETIQKAVQDNNTSVYSVGDTKSIDLGDLGEHTVRIANMSTPSECETSGFSQTACGFVVEFVDIITKHAMNSTNTNVGGWASSEMRTYVNSDIYNAIVSVTGNIIVDTTVVSGHGSTSEESNFTTTDKVYLLAGHEIWLYDHDYMTYDIDLYDTAYNNTRQLDYYANNNVSSSNYSGAIKQYNGSNYFWWLRATYFENAQSFLGVTMSGIFYYFGASSAQIGVSPAFRIG